ncbi:MAG: nuclear transport factor 2 family protein [Sphingomonas sp.]
MLITLTSLLLAAASAPAGVVPPVEPRTEAAVVAADKAWGTAEERGDGAYVDWLLMPGYVSIGHDGKVHTKAAIVTNANSRKGQNPAEMAAKTAAWRTAHPYRTEVKLFGDTAVVSFLSTKPDSGEPVNSSDIFVYHDRHWHPIYSQHSDAGS